ncbi:MAG: DUF3179 domain-containing protein [bacterium]|nr:DUF3179 domain-containing protein [bacterium]
MKKISIIILSTFLLTACIKEKVVEEKVEIIAESKTIVKDVGLQNDFEGAKIKESALLDGCFTGKDCIPSIENPKFQSVEAANLWLNDEDMVFAIEYKGVQRAYPQRILNWHEIVNDEIAGDPIAITFCPLCGSALAFERKVDGVITELGVSGKLHNSDLVMYDRYEGNLWQQITGEGIVGPAALRNEILTQVPISTTTWGQWKKEFPSTEVLSTDTGYSRDYSAYPYGTYESDDDLYFQVGSLNDSIQIKTPIYGIEVDGSSKAYTREALLRDGKIKEKLGGINIQIELLDSGEIKATNLDSGEPIIPIRLFWFAWASFHPDTELYK